MATSESENYLEFSLLLGALKGKTKGFAVGALIIKLAIFVASIYILPKDEFFKIILTVLFFAAMLFVLFETPKFNLRTCPNPE